MNKRERQKSDGFVRHLIVPEAVLARGVSGDGLRLYLYLLAHHESVTGPLGDLAGDRYFRNAGMGKRAIERAGQELAEKGLYSYGWERRPDGTFSRVQWVTEVPDTLMRPEPTRRPVSTTTHRLSSGNAGSKQREQVRPAERHPADVVPARQRQFSPQGRELVRPAETPAERGIAAGGDLFSPQDREQVRPAETPAETGIAAGGDLFSPQDREQVRPAETPAETGIAAGQAGEPSRARLPYKNKQPTLGGNPPPSPREVPGPRRHPEEEGILISVAEARAWLGRLPFRSQIRPGTSLGPVVAQFLSAPGPWPRPALMRELCADLDTARNVEAVLHTRLKDLNPIYDPAEYVQHAVEPNAVVVEGQRVPVDQLKPAEEFRTAANDEFRRMREMQRQRKAGAEGNADG